MIFIFLVIMCYILINLVYFSVLIKYEIFVFDVVVLIFVFCLSFVFGMVMFLIVFLFCFGFFNMGIFIVVRGIFFMVRER